MQCVGCSVQTWSPNVYLPTERSRVGLLLPKVQHHRRCPQKDDLGHLALGAGRYLDGQPIQVPIKGGHRWAEWQFVIVTTNHHPTVWFPDADDWWQELWHGNNFGAANPSALQRRIDMVYSFDGVFPFATVAPSYPPTLVEMLAQQASHEDDDADAASDATVSEQAKPAESNPLPPSPQLDEEDAVLADFADQDNDFLRGIDLLPEQDDPDHLFEGTDGDLEPLGGEDLLGFSPWADVR